MNSDSIARRLEEIMILGQRVLVSTNPFSDSDHTFVESKSFQTFRTASLSFLSVTFGVSHPYYSEFDKSVTSEEPYDVERGIGILEAVKSEINGGWLFSVKGLVSAEIFSDFLEMADYLLSEGYKDPAAVIIGGVLEEHLRQLSAKYNISIESIKDGKLSPKKADTLNSELTAAAVYTKLDQKGVTFWLDLRNKAAHGKYTEYTIDQVKSMSQGVGDFIRRVAL